MRLILIRHPETMANVNRLIYGRTQSDYSPLGASSIPWVVSRLRGIPIDRLYASPLERTAYLAKQIARDHGIQEIQMEDRVLEMNFGILENMTNEQANTRYPKVYQGLMDDYNHFLIPGGESFQLVKERVTEFLKELEQTEKQEQEKGRQDPKSQDYEGRAQGGILTRDREKTIVVVTHSMVIRSALSYLLGMDLSDSWHIKINPASIVDVDYRCGYAMLQQMESPELAQPF